MDQQNLSPDKIRALAIQGKIDYLLANYLDEAGNLKNNELTQGATLRSQLEQIRMDLEHIGK